ncbi:MAG: GTP-binding protein [Eudoraea sp.]|nr:GTP-binding protein [Eudoraea sp.]
MKTLPNKIVLRPRFRQTVRKSKAMALDNFTENKKKPFILNRIDDHIIIKYNNQHAHFWSPQLHLEFIEEDANSCEVHGLFGPSPPVWTFFMFLHFGVATLFIVLGIWAYSNISLDRPYGLQLGLMIMMVLFWIVFYIFGRLGKKKGRPQMHELYSFMQEALK